MFFQDDVAETHTSKINKLIGIKTHRSTVVDQEKWVVSISKRDLTPVEITALRKGLNFSITPNKVPVSKILSSIETGIHNLSQSTKDTIGVSVASTLKICNLPATVNITREEKTALDDLTKNEEVTIAPADKEGSVVVMDKDEYQEKVFVLLNDANTYLKITDKRSNPTSKSKKI